MFDSDIGDCCELNLESLQLQDFENDWKQYNPRKPIARWGLSLTSLDGGMTGNPDLDSLFEFNRLNGTKYGESGGHLPSNLLYRGLSPFKFCVDY